jgi:FKBP-type peptidyl-prolyl cis-trans isomerase
VALLLGAASLAQAAPQAAAPAKTAPAAKSPAAGDAKAKASYAIGLQFGQRLHGALLTDKTISLPEIQRGMHDALAGKEFGQEDLKAIQVYIQSVQASVADENKKKSEAFFAANGKKPGVTTTASGLQYKVLTQGKGDPPKKTDTVSVNYTGRLLDGNEFDGTDKHGGQPVNFPVTGVIPGFTEALLLMKPGAKYQVFIPPALAYGDTPPQGAPIPPGAALVFDIELVKVLPPAPPQTPSITPPHPAPTPH